MGGNRIIKRDRCKSKPQDTKLRIKTNEKAEEILKLYLNQTQLFKEGIKRKKKILKQL